MWTILQQVPPKEGKMRFGNTAFKEFHSKVCDLNEKFVDKLLTFLKVEKTCALELSTYLNESYGDNSRIDYGTGHELNFMVFLFCVNKLKPYDKNEYEALIHKVFYDYIFTMRKI